MSTSHAAAIQAIASVLLVAVTIYYAWTNRRLTNLTRDMLRSTDAATEESRNAYMNSAMPTISILTRIDSRDLVTDFKLHLVNIGVGPALDLVFSFPDEAIGAVLAFIPPTVDILGVGESRVVMLTVPRHSEVSEADLIRRLDNKSFVVNVRYSDVYNRERCSQVTLRPDPSSTSFPQLMVLSPTSFTLPTSPGAHVPVQPGSEDHAAIAPEV